MKFNTRSRVVSAALIGLLAFCVVSQSWAAIQDYEFRLVSREIKKGEAIIAVRLVNKVTGKLVPDAVIFAIRLDMAPDGMQEMATRVLPIPSAEPGIYQFKANVSMAGGWQLSLGAKVQGETGSIENKLVIKAVP